MSKPVSPKKSFDRGRQMWNLTQGKADGVSVVDH